MFVCTSVYEMRFLAKRESGVGEERLEVRFEVGDGQVSSSSGQAYHFLQTLWTYIGQSNALPVAGTMGMALSFARVIRVQSK